MSLQADILKDRLHRLGFFAPDDLSFNQNGEMSPLQMRQIQRFARFWYICLGIYLVLMVVMCVLTILIGFLEHNISHLFSLTVFWALILGLFGSFSYSFVRPYLLDLRENKVQLVLGELHKFYITISPNKVSMSICNIDIKGQIFAIPVDVYNNVVDHQVYRLFYLPHSRKIVNLVPFS